MRPAPHPAAWMTCSKPSLTGKLTECFLSGLSQARACKLMLSDSGDGSNLIFLSPSLRGGVGGQEVVVGAGRAIIASCRELVESTGQLKAEGRAGASLLQLHTPGITWDQLQGQEVGGSGP